MLTPVDKFIVNFDHAIKTLFGKPPQTDRPNPSDKKNEQAMSDNEKKHAAALMRINHSGEVAAQGLYQGQALTARLPQVRAQMEQSAIEENDHLIWCEKRCQELHSHTSYLGPFWYLGSFSIGAVAGLAGDKWSLGFVAETEKQVVKHIDSHLQKLPKQDGKSQAILAQMREDELHHATIAKHAGGAELPEAIKQAMTLTSKIMTKTAYYI